MVDQPYPYQRRELTEPDWRRFPGWADVTAADYPAQLTEVLHAVRALPLDRLPLLGGHRGPAREPTPVRLGKLGTPIRVRLADHGTTSDPGTTSLNVILPYGVLTKEDSVSSDLYRKTYGEWIE